MRTAVISFTKNGERLSRKIAESVESDRFAFEKYPCAGAKPFSSLGALMEEIFEKYDALIFICAVGIAVRAAAPHLVSKFSDPAVVALDEGGRFAVSLLSGHIGGANSLTRRVAEAVGAQAVITTATDSGGKFSPDCFAASNNLCILEKDILKEIAAAVVNGEKIGFESEFLCKNMPKEFFGEKCETGLYVGFDTKAEPFFKTLHLVPRNIVLGAGCKKGTEYEKFFRFVRKSLREINIPIWRVGALHTIEKKRGETAFEEFCRKNKAALRFFTAYELMSAEGEFEASDFVMKTVGADNVCERAAALGGRIILKKRAEDGMTLAAAEAEVRIDKF